MGKKTHESSPHKPLLNTLNIVLSNNLNFFPDPDVNILRNVGEVLKYLKKYDDEVFIIGDGMVYNLVLPHMDKIYTTTVHANVGGDTYASYKSKIQWKILSHKKIHKVDVHTLADYSL